jgi:hypothetical protein
LLAEFGQLGKELPELLKSQFVIFFFGLLHVCSFILKQKLRINVDYETIFDYPSPHPSTGSTASGALWSAPAALPVDGCSVA